MYVCFFFVRLMMCIAVIVIRMGGWGSGRMDGWMEESGEVGRWGGR